MKIEITCPKCQTPLELSASDAELRDRLAAEAKVKNVEFLNQAEKFARNFSEEGDARALYWSFLAQVQRSSLGVIERFYEYAYVVEKLRGVSGSSILDVGSAFTTLPSVLAAMGHAVTCLDLREWKMSWPGVQTVKGDLLQLDAPLPFGVFDYITCVSTIEHLGLSDRYGGRESVDGDFEGMCALRDHLKSNGRMLLTVPVGKPAVVYPAHRVYDSSRFSRLISEFHLLDERYFRRESTTFYLCSREEAYLTEPIDAKKLSSYSIICCLLEKEVSQ